MRASWSIMKQCRTPFAGVLFVDGEQKSARSAKRFDLRVDCAIMFCRLEIGFADTPS